MTASEPAHLGDDPLRVLALDHYFDQDLKALETRRELEVRRIPFERLRRPAIRIMGSDVGTGLEAFTLDGLEGARDRYGRWLHREFERMYLESPFDVVVLPSDVFFYVRHLPNIAHAFGIPVVVVQKETTISPETMGNWAPVVAQYAPFASDRMTVCSERQKEFWVRAGADPALVAVTGQPRFDVYWNSPPPRPSARRNVLFFSYAVDAYVADDELGQPVWSSLRGDTESVLAELAASGDTLVVVKPHPQQSREGEVERLRRLAGENWGRSFVLADPEADTRELVLASDVVVGFQSTALYEAVAVSRPVVYAAWGKEWERRRDHLIPFHQAPSACLHHAQDADSLRGLLRLDLEPPGPAARRWYEDAIGTIDGSATDRVVHELFAATRQWGATPELRSLSKHRRRFAARRLLGSTGSELLWFTADLPAAVLRRRTGVATRRFRARENRKLAWRGLKEGPRSAAGGASGDDDVH